MCRCIGVLCLERREGTEQETDHLLLELIEMCIRDRCRPTDWNKVAAIGNRMIYPASPTILDNSPKTMTSRIMRQGSRGRRTRCV